MTINIIEKINNFDTSAVNKKALLDIYHTSLDEDNGYWIKPVNKVLEYLVEVTNEVPQQQNGIDFDDLVDPDSAWCDLDERILDVIFVKDLYKILLILVGCCLCIVSSVYCDS